MILQVIFSENRIFTSHIFRRFSLLMGVFFIFAVLYFTYYKIIVQNCKYIVLAVPAGYLTYVMSLFIVGIKLNRNSLFPFKCFKFDKTTVKSTWRQIVKTIFTSSFEEFFIRGSVQTILTLLMGEPFIPIIISVTIFVIMHCDRRRALIQVIDLTVFSLILSIIFCITNSIWIVAIIHIIRNSLLICFFNSKAVERKQSFGLKKYSYQ